MLRSTKEQSGMQRNIKGLIINYDYRFLAFLYPQSPLVNSFTKQNYQIYFKINKFHVTNRTPANGPPNFQGGKDLSLFVLNPSTLALDKLFKTKLTWENSKRNLMHT